MRYRVVTGFLLLIAGIWPAAAWSARPLFIDAHQLVQRQKERDRLTAQLQFAAATGDEQSVFMLLASGADWRGGREWRGEREWRGGREWRDAPLILAARGGHHRVVDYLVSAMDTSSPEELRIADEAFRTALARRHEKAAQALLPYARYLFGIGHDSQMPRDFTPSQRRQHLFAMNFGRSPPLFDSKKPPPQDLAHYQLNSKRVLQREVVRPDVAVRPVSLPPCWCLAVTTNAISEIAMFHALRLALDPYAGLNEPIASQAPPELDTLRRAPPEMYLAARYGDAAVMEYLLRAGADPNQPCPFVGNLIPPLEVAAEFDQPEIAGLLLRWGANQQPADERRLTPLHIAAAHGSARAAQVLIEHQADVHAADAKGFTPLFHAAAAGHAEVVELLAAAGADVNARVRIRSVVDAAVENGHAAAIRVLEARGAKLDAFALATLGDLDSLRTLLAEQPDELARRRFHGRTVLHQAVLAAQVETVKFLLDDAKLDVAATSDAGDTPLHHAARQGNRPIAAALLAAGADINAVNLRLETPLRVAASDESFERWLRERGAK